MSNIVTDALGLGLPMRTSKRLETVVGRNMGFCVVTAFDAFGAALPKALVFCGALPGTFAFGTVRERDPFQG